MRMEQMHGDCYAHLGGFDKIEAPLRRIDALVDDFAKKIGGTVERNRHEVAMRYVSVARGRIHRGIQIMTFSAGPNFRRGPTGVEYGVVGHAWIDERSARHSWSKAFASWPGIPRSRATVERVLEGCWEETRQIRKGDMTMHTSISAAR
jgi:hypothetical protein